MDMSLSTTGRQGKALHDEIEEIRDAAGAVASEDARDYAAGVFANITDPEQRQALGLRSVRTSGENVIAQCLEQIAGRMLFRSYECDDPDVRTYLAEFTRKNRLREMFAGAVIHALTDGNAAMSVSWDERRGPLVHHENWWNGTEGMFVAKDTAGDVIWAVGEWIDRQERERRTLYLPDRIMRFVKDGRGWRRMGPEVPWVKKDGSPLGVPVAHFPGGIAPTGPYAPSTVKGVLGRQDELNASLFDRSAASALTGAQIYTATGVTDDEKPVVGPGRRWTAKNPDAKFGVLPPGPLGELLTHSDDLRASIASAFPVPSYRIGRGQWPSGMALAQADSPMIAKVKLLEDLFDPGATLLSHRATEMANTFGGESLNERALITTSWMPADQVDPATQMELDRLKIEMYAELERLTPTMMRKTGMLTEDEIEAIIREREAMIEPVAAIEPDQGEEEDN